MPRTIPELDAFLAEWTDTPEKNRQAFIELKNQLDAKTGVVLSFVARPEVTYSLRAAAPNQTGRPLFVMVDVIEDQPRWLSVCFYADTVQDPDELGDYVPEGLLGEDAVCFDLESYDAAILAYLRVRIDEAFTSVNRP
jgi:hypothetical protein